MTTGQNQASVMTETTAKIVYDVCSQCAEEAGGTWPAGHVATMSTGKCDVCYLDRIVCSPGDWNWPRGRRPKHWVSGRD